MLRYIGLFAFVLAVVGCLRGAEAVPIAESCAIPVSSAGRNIFYVDPLKGSMSNDGSAVRPWSTLAEVLDSKRKLVAAPSAPVKPGDIIYLNSGDHGNVQVTRAINTEFITVQAAPGQTPRLRSLRVNGASRWMFAGLKVQGAGDGSSSSLPGYALIEFGKNLSLGPTSNIIFSGSSVSTTDDSSAWTDLDWVKKPFIAGLASSATCVTISGNHFFNLRNAVQFDADHHLVADNKIDNFGADAIDIVASHVTVRGNTITNGRNTKADSTHADAIQGWTKKDVTNTNVLIEGNVIIKTGDPLVTYLQGITIFDGKWDGLTISNNVVLTNHWHGITVLGAANTRIINNTVVAYDPVKYPTWITVQNAKDGRPSENVIVRNNITTRLVHHGDKVTVDHNIVAKMIATSVSGKPVFFSKPGSYGNGNIVAPEIYDTVVSVDHAKGLYDLRLKANSPAVGRGNAEHAPSADILGKRRTVPIDIGAYARPN